MKTELIELTKNETISVSEDTQFVVDFSLKNRINTGPFRDDIPLENNKKTSTLSLPAYGTKENPYTLNFIMEKEGVEAEIIGLYKLRDNEQLSFTTIADHKAPNTKCLTTIKGVLMDNSASSYTGKIIIEKKAQQTVSYLEDNVLVIGENTKNNSQPFLQIDADDVKASHGATTGKVDEDEIYYLQTRGLSRDEAIEILTKGFLESLLSKIKSEKIKKLISKELYA